MIAYMIAASLDRPYRGSGVDRPVGVPLPPDHLPLFRSGQLRKHWQYVSFWSRELSFCAARANVGPLRKEYWGIWDRASKRFRQRAHLFTRRVQIEPNRVYARDDDTEIDVTFEDCASFEVYRPAGHAYIWSRKDYCREARGVIRHGGTERAVAGVMFVDVNAGYHERSTHWRWSAGSGRDQHGRLVAFNAIIGLHDGPVDSERTIWIDGDEREIGPVTFSDDLSTVSFAEGGTLRFQPESLIEQHTNLLLIRSDYLHWFGVFTGTLPGGIELDEAPGVRERHDALW
jgi:Protein of unknown function (DUF2804)